MSTSASWEIPEAVEPPTGEAVKALYDRFTSYVGIRTPGWICLAAGVASLSFGLSFGWQELAIIGVALLLLFGIALLFMLGRPKLAVGLRVSDISVVVGKPAMGLVQVHTAPGTRHLGSRLDLPVGKERASFWLPMMGGGQQRDFSFAIPTERRGLVVVGPANSLQGDPFGLTGRETRWTESVDVYVHPRTVRLPGRQLGFVHDLEGNPSDRLSPSDMNFHALRPYVPGDDRRHVHWKSTARAGQLLVRQFEETRMSTVLVALDTGRRSYIDDDEFELAVSVAASIAQHAIWTESPLTMITTKQQLRAGTATTMLDECSLIEMTARGGIGDLTQTATSQSFASSIVYLITGSTASMQDMRRAGSRFDVDTRFIGIRVDAGAELRNQRVGNTSINQVGELDHLPRAVRRSMQ
ncbi:DUF58 domain-containing protein [Tessaracoccus sp. OH4464_COT-324]|uniref:DUF58 domain-containing protein n=1 Tax=Tessaracoccus sp. OH4464_COT-324 TaxID=2491059 RepID=UPI000F640877|nr:DUF58 domain-containing protein [Tessaracoccus sp. OH4464_COT-324]RRD46058.1 DUF58 domain-containing protein [Tessaracoccus sp. OH4464_COT-324]